MNQYETSTIWPVNSCYNNIREIYIQSSTTLKWGRVTFRGVSSRSASILTDVLENARKCRISTWLSCSITHLSIWCCRSQNVLSWSHLITHRLGHRFFQIASFLERSLTHSISMNTSENWWTYLISNWIRCLETKWRQTRQRITKCALSAPIRGDLTCRRSVQKKSKHFKSLRELFVPVESILIKILSRMKWL